MPEQLFELVEREDGTVVVIVRAANDNEDPLYLNGDPDYAG